MKLNYKMCAALSLCLLAASFLTMQDTYADIPHVINHQGLVMVEDRPFVGTGLFKFGLVGPDGRWVWTNDGSHLGELANSVVPNNAVSLYVPNGIYNVQLGRTTIPNMTAIPRTAFDESDVKLRVIFNDGVNGEAVLAPDQDLNSVPYAYRAGTADLVQGQDVGSELSDIREILALSPPVIEMVNVPAGQFEMGPRDDGDDLLYRQARELPRHWVQLDAYQIGKYKITNRQYASVMQYASRKGYLKDVNGDSWGGGDIWANVNGRLQRLSAPIALEDREGYSVLDFPKDRITWWGAAAFCNWLSEWMELTPAYDLATGELIDASAVEAGLQYTNGYRLPTEAEWERAAAWDGTKHWTYGVTFDSLDCTRANFKPGAYCNPLGFSEPYYTSPVGYYNGENIGTVLSVSPVGCYDMCGLLFEHCHDRFKTDYYSTGGPIWLNPTGPARSGTDSTVQRGGAYNEGPGNCRTAARGNKGDNDDAGPQSFRVVRTP